MYNAVNYVKSRKASLHNSNHADTDQDLVLMLNTMVKQHDHWQKVALFSSHFYILCECQGLTYTVLLSLSLSDSFALVEVSELGCPVSVYSVSTPNPETCTAWISTIHQAQVLYDSNLDLIDHKGSKLGRLAEYIQNTCYIPSSLVVLYKCKK